ncbi:ATP-binding protein [Massilia niabensis]|uniref:histidine kinase n=1 Tax=Massilia niabensis TaxID=544910 RepID=A0ABW0L3N1_9BURK
MFDGTAGNPENPSVIALRESITLTIDSGTPQTMPAQHYPIKVRKADGAEVYEDRYWNAVNAPVFDAAGRLLFILHQTFDITEQVKAQAQQRETTELYSTLIESMDDGFCIVDVIYDDAQRPVDYRFLDVNRAFEDQTGLKNARGKSVLELVPHSDSHWAELYSVVALTGKPLRLVEEPSPLGRWFNVYATRVGDPKEGKVAVLFTDVTNSMLTKNELRTLATDLSNENRRKTEFLATLAHELRNPLAPIRTGLELIRLSEANPAARARIYGMMERQLNQLVHLIDDLLDIARINSGKVELKKERIDLRDAVTNAVEASLPMIQAARHELDVSMPDVPLVLYADPTRCTQIVSNLLTNAAKYTPSGGRIAVSIEHDDDSVTIAITDTGIGIPADALSEVFDMFSQVSRNMGRAQGGLGIGLSLVRSLVEMHGGSVSAESAGAGMGSSFVVRLPLMSAVEVDRSLPLQQPAEAPVPEGKSLKVLVADDNVDAANTIMALLEMSGHDVDIVHDGRQALEKAKACAYDLAILDIGMPGLSGYEVAAALRQIAGHENTFLAALTGWGAEEDRARSKTAGFNAHLTKPAAVSEINQLLSPLLRGRAKVGSLNS